MLEPHEMSEILAGLDYKPDWTLSVEMDEWEGPFLRVLAAVQNSYAQHEETIDLQIDTYVSPNDRESRESFLRFVQWRLVRIESHESREYLRDREAKAALYDPHAMDDGLVYDVFNAQEADRRQSSS